MSTVLVSAGDASGDAYAADVVSALRQLRPGLRCVGLGGPALAAAGAELVADLGDLQVGGFVEVAPHLPRVARAWRAVRAALAAESPDLALLVDSSGFNLPLARRVRRARVPALYYVSPQVWVWRRGRMRKLARRVDRLAVILPFEAAFWAGAGVPVSYVGHPLVERARAAAAKPAEARRALGLDPGGRWVALLPGSRHNELAHCLPVFLATARALHARDPSLRFVLPVAPGIERASVDAAVRRAALPSLLELHAVPGRSLEVLSACDVALVKPGTGTLEAALLARPLVVAARAHPLTAALARRLVTIDFAAMPNLIAGARIVPELLQGDAVPERVADAVVSLLDGPAREEQLRALAAVRERIGPGGAARRTAEIAEEMLRAGARS